MLLEAAKRAGVEQWSYTSTVATIAVDRPQLPNELTDAKLQEMVGPHKRPQWVGGKEGPHAPEKGRPAIWGLPATNNRGPPFSALGGSPSPPHPCRLYV